MEARWESFGSNRSQAPAHCWHVLMPAEFVEHEVAVALGRDSRPGQPQRWPSPLGLPPDSLVKAVRANGFPSWCMIVHSELNRTRMYSKCTWIGGVAGRLTNTRWLPAIMRLDVIGLTTEHYIAGGMFADGCACIIVVARNSCPREQLRGPVYPTFLLQTMEDGLHVSLRRLGPDLL